MTAQVYDTGLLVSQRSAIRAQVIENLAPLLFSNGMYLRAIKPLARPLAGAGDEEGLALINLALGGQAPAVLVALGKKTYEAAGSDYTIGRGILDVVVYVCSANPRAMDVGRLSPDVVSMTDVTADPGIETMLEHVEQLLDGQDIGVHTVYEMLGEAEDVVYSGLDYTIAEQLYRVKVDRVINAERLLTTIATSISATTTLGDNDPNTAPNPIVTTITDLEAP